jgi:hypothetical protein
VGAGEAEWSSQLFDMFHLFHHKIKTSEENHKESEGEFLCRILKKNSPISIQSFSFRAVA